MFRSIVRTFGEATAVVIGEEYLPPAPGPTQVRVRMSLASINPSDLITISGAYASRTKLPFVPGFEGVGVVESVGAEVSDLSVGQRVLPLGSAGAWQDVKIADAHWCFPVALELTDEQAATAYINPLTALLMVRQYAPRNSAPVAVNAASSAIGRMIIRLLNDVGHKPIALVRNPGGRALLADLELTAVVCTTEPHPRDDLRATLHEITGGQGLAAAWDAVGGSEGADLYRALSPGGTLIHYGLMSGRPLPTRLQTERPDARLVMFRLRDWMHTAERSILAGALEDVYRLLLDGAVASTVAAIYPLPEVRDALRIHVSAHRGGKVLLRPS